MGTRTHKKRATAKLAKWRNSPKGRMNPAKYALIVWALAKPSDTDFPEMQDLGPRALVRAVFPALKPRHQLWLAKKIGNEATFEAKRAEMTQRHPFYQAIYELSDWLRADFQNGVRMWCALANVQWYHEDGREFSVSFRTAGSIIAKIRAEVDPEDREPMAYMNYYCMGPDGTVCETIGTHFRARGWIPRDYSDEVIESVSDEDVTPRDLSEG